MQSIILNSSKFILSSDTIMLLRWISVSQYPFQTMDTFAWITSALKSIPAFCAWAYRYADIDKAGLHLVFAIFLSLNGCIELVCLCNAVRIYTSFGITFVDITEFTALAISVTPTPWVPSCHNALRNYRRLYSTISGSVPFSPYSQTSRKSTQARVVSYFA